MSDDKQTVRNFARDVAKTIEIESVEAAVEGQDELVADYSAKKPPHASAQGIKKTVLRLMSLRPFSRGTTIFKKRRTGTPGDVTQFATTDFRNALFDEQIDADTAVDELYDVEANFQLEEEIAIGGQGSISRARDRKFSRVVAMKSLHGELKERPEYRRAFISEAKITAQLEHPSIIPVYGIYGDAEQGLHLAMKLVRGKTLTQYLTMLREQYELMPRRRIIRSESSILKQRLEYFQRVCEAIAYVHHNQIIHRDLKPDNIMIGNFNETYVMDWGIAEQVETDPEAFRKKRPSGTLQYISPEVINRRPYDCRSDIYLLGLILFEVVLLKPAYVSKDAKEALSKAKLGELDSFQHAFGCTVDEDLLMIMQKALAYLPEERYQSVEELLDDVRAFLQAERVAANPQRFWGEVRYQFRRHYKGLTLAGTFMALLLLSLSSFSLYRENKNQRRQKAIEALFSEIFTNGLLCGARFDSRMKDYEKYVAELANEASWRLEDAGQRSLPPRRAYSPQDAQKALTAPPGLGYADGYKQQISLEHPVCVAAPGKKLADFQDELAALLPLRHSFLRLLSVELGESFCASEDSVCQALFAQQPPLFNWVYISLASGLHINFPYHDDYPAEFDGRERPYYTQALAMPPGRAVWGMPHVDSSMHRGAMVSCSQAFYNSQGEAIGMVGADVGVDTLVAVLSRTGNRGPYVKNKYLVNGDGRIIAQSGLPVLPWHQQTQAALTSSFHNHSLLKAMWQTRNGRIFTSENERRYFYFFMHIETLNWLYVERIDYQQLLDSEI